jgi:hypothetical protein
VRMALLYLLLVGGSEESGQEAHPATEAPQPLSRRATDTKENSSAPADKDPSHASR